ncbi:MAG: insulinase family protein [Lachnospiraceae bacterium]|nr:insulinase family protein [Lachnospiraceae bacterium]
MKKYIVNMAHLHSCVVGLYFHGGSLIEDKNTAGISHLLEHLIFRRLESMEMCSLYAKLNKMGCTLHGFTSEKMIGFYIQTSPEKAEAATELLLKILAEYDWTEREISLEKRVVMRQIDEHTEYFFDKKVNRKYYRNTPFAKSIMGQTEHVENLSADTINEYKNKIFCSENAAFIMTGNFTKASKESTVKKLDVLSLKDNRKAIYDKNRCQYHPKHFGVRTKKDDLLVACECGLCDVNISFDVPHSCNTYTVDLLMDILINGDGAKLSWKLKDTKGWAGDIFGTKECFHDFSRIKIEYSVSSVNLIQSLQCLTKTVQKTKETLSEKDRKRAIEFYRFQPELMDDPIAYNSYIAEMNFGCEYSKYKVEDIVAEYEKITADELKQLMNDIFVSDHMIISVAYDRESVKKSLLEKACKKMRKILKG